MDVGTIYVTERAWESFGSRVQTVCRSARAVQMANDGGLHVDGEPIDRNAADADVAWITADLFDEGAPLRAYFGLLRRLPSLRWAQTPAAGTDAPIWRELLTR